FLGEIMKLGFRRHGKQFFFYTACLRGRPKILSQLKEGVKWPLLSACGEAVKATMLDFHQKNHALTLSDYVIMPDHVHFLLIVDFDLDPQFDPLGFIYRWRTCAAQAIIAVVRGISPDRLWERSFWISLAWYSEQRKAIRHYIRNNPARALWKANHPDRFCVIQHVRHPALDADNPWSAMGDLTLIASPFRFPVRLTRRLTIKEQEAALGEAMTRAQTGMIPISGFISPAEHELEYRLRNEPTARWIKALPHGLAAGYDPSVEDSRALAEGRLLLLSSFSPSVPASPITRSNCELMNERILSLCGEAVEPICTS
ncbi:MAG: transposase, partial [Victivallales bacterium]|nr:transposase [Victivallales bacterium]